MAEATFAQKRLLVELLIDRVMVTNEGVEIRYVIPTSSSSEHLRFGPLRSDYFNQPGLGALTSQQLGMGATRHNGALVLRATVYTAVWMVGGTRKNFWREVGASCTCT